MGSLVIPYCRRQYSLSGQLGIAKEAATQENTLRSGLFFILELVLLNCISKAEWLYSFFRVQKIPMIAPIRIIGATLTNSHSNE